MKEAVIARQRDRAQQAYERAISRLGQSYRDACDTWRRAYEEGR